MPLMAGPATLPRRQETTRPVDDISTEFSPLYNVVLLDDNYHSYDYVMGMLTTLIGCPSAWAFEMAREVDTTGRVIINTTGLEEARELQKKVHAYGADYTIPACKGSMTAIVEPAT